jgi:sec-independent protein translocase protein TatB
MFNIGTGEIALIAVAALLILGPQRLPELARGIGKFMREFRRQTDEVRTVVEREFYKLDDDASRKGAAPDVPDVVAANSVPRVAAGSSKPHDELLPPGEPVRSQLTSGAPATEPVSTTAAPSPASDPSGTAKS